MLKAPQAVPIARPGRAVNPNMPPTSVLPDESFDKATDDAAPRPAVARDLGGDEMLNLVYPSMTAICAGPCSETILTAQAFLPESREGDG